MSGIKYSLRQESTSFSIGTTNLRSSNGSLIDTNGCVALLVLSGFAVATINFEKRILRKGDFVLLFMIVLFLCYLFRLLFGSICIVCISSYRRSYLQASFY